MFYRSLASLMPPELPIHAIESLELGYSGEIKPASIEETAAAYVGNMLKIQPAGPFRIAGYSFGGVVAYEIACQLVRLGHEVQFLGLFDTHNPAGYSRNYNLSERLRVFWLQNSDVPFWSRVKRVRARVREGIHTKRRIKAELKASILKGPAEAYSDLRRVQVREENWRAMRAYQPGSFSGRITLFKASSINDKVERPADYGWACLAGAGLDIVSVTGDHLSLFAPENISTLASGLSHSLSASRQ
jgi:thioesterase domain-containing protein